MMMPVRGLLTVLIRERGRNAFIAWLLDMT